MQITINAPVVNITVNEADPRITQMLQQIIDLQQQEKVTDMASVQQLTDLLGQTNQYTNRIATAIEDIAGDQQSLIDALKDAKDRLEAAQANPIPEEVITKAQENLDTLNALAAGLENTAAAYPPAAPSEGESSTPTEGTPIPEEAPGAEPLPEEGTETGTGSTPNP